MANTGGDAPFIDFGVDRTSIRTGECATFHWHVERVREVYFFREGERWQDHGVTGREQRQVCPTQDTTYCLRVVKGDGSVEMRQIGIHVQADVPLPTIQHFGLNPQGQIGLGGCVNIDWRVAGAVHQVRLLTQRGVLWDNAPAQGQVQDCPNTPGQTTYTLEVVGPGGTSRAQRSITLVGERPVEPPPPPPPPAPDKAVIEAFTVRPERIRAGECVTIDWRTGGATSWVTIVRDEHVVQDNAPRAGSAQDCPQQPGRLKYRIIAYNPQDKRVREDRFVSVV